MAYSDLQSVAFVTKERCVESVEVITSPDKVQGVWIDGFLHSRTENKPEYLCCSFNFYFLLIKYWGNGYLNIDAGYRCDEQM